MARLPAFQRKPGLTVAIMAGKSGADGHGDAPDEGEDGGEDEGPPVSDHGTTHNPKDIAVCPSCGCTFDDESGEVLDEGHPQHPGQLAGGKA